ncbi:MAG: ABC transporter ATP-binding protein [Planctomycetes bacterium]|nr:ABC transporter ATP-binding protein [Planctomycetota bacterium]
MIEIQSLRKAYGSLVAVHDLTLSVAPGEILALLGPNGAGKSTTVSCIVGLQRQDAGIVKVDGLDTLHAGTEVRRRVSYVPEVANLYDSLTPDEYLRLRGRLFDMEEPAIKAGILRLLDGFGILHRQHDPMVGFSKGMMQKVVIAGALLTDPKVLVLDEPLSGLDVETTLVLKEIMREFARRGGAVLYCSHMLDVVETVADAVAILSSGQLVAKGSLAELRSAGRGDRRLEEIFRELTSTSDPVARARAILGG